MQLDDAVPRALRSLLGENWQAKLKRAVAREMQPPKLEPKRRNLTEAQREARRQSMLAIIAAKKAAKEAAAAPAVDRVARGHQAAVTRKANQAARAPTDMTDPALNAEELHEARAKLAKGEGALALREWFGGGLGWWQAWCERQRAAA